jgi:hypothetical protein
MYNIDLFKSTANLDCLLITPIISDKRLTLQASAIKTTSIYQLDKKISEITLNLKNYY